MDTQPAMRKGAWIAIAACVLLISAFHYLTRTDSVVSHNIYRRLYYVPIVWAALLGGWRGGLLVAAAVTAFYVPHAFFMHNHLDPAPPTDKALEIVLFFGVGGLSGWLVDREHRARRRAARAALARIQAENRAERLSGLVHLSRGLAHEIRNPLGGIQGAIEILADGEAESGPRREMVEVALRETTRLGRVLDDFLSFARPREPKPEAFDPRSMVEHVVELFGPQAEQQEIALRADIRSQGWALADPEQTVGVLVNLVRNALEHTPPGGTITVTAADAPGAAGPRIRLSVSDTGPGVPDDLGDSIYDPYMTTREEGSGLGLSTSAMLVRKNGGSLGHQANPTGGAIFSFDLPAAERTR